MQVRGSDQIRYCGAILEIVRADVPGADIIQMHRIADRWYFLIVGLVIGTE